MISPTVNPLASMPVTTLPALMPKYRSHAFSVPVEQQSSRHLRAPISK